MAEFIDEKYFDDYEVLTPNGWKDFEGIGKTIEYDIWILTLNNGYEIKCADNHIVITKEGERFVKDLTLEDYIETNDGFIKVKNIQTSLIKENMYDLVNVDGSIYYTNNISSHNSTVIATYALWYSIFHPDKTIGIVSNKALSAIDIMARIKITYEELPPWLKPGVREYSKTFTTFDNESKIIVSATSADAFRGRTLNLLVADEFAFVRKNIAEDFWSANYPTISSSQDAKIVIISCVTGDTHVFTDKGIKQVNDFVKPEIKGGYELNPYSILGKNKINHGNLFVNSGKSKTRIIESTSSKLEGSLNHKLWACKNGIYNWYKLSELEIGDYISIQYGTNLWGNNDSINFKFTSMNYEKKEKIINRKLQNCKQLKIDKITPDWAYLFGLYISEGNAYKHGLCISCGDDISWIFKKLNIKYNCRDGMHYTISSTAVSELLKYVGFDITKRAPQKEIPSRLLEMSKENIISMLQGIFDGDGWSRKDRGTVGIGLSSEKLINQIRMILLNFGILTDYYVVKSIKERCTGKVKSNSIQYRLSCGYNDSRRFYDIVGFKINRKQIKKNSLPIQFKEAKIDVIPFANVILGNITNELKEKYNIKIHKQGLRKHISRPKMLKIKEVLKQYGNLKEFLENISENIKWEKIKNIKESENDVFDFSLPDIKNDKWCHSIIYNGLIGHQTPNGMWNLFHKIYTEAEHCENTFVPLKFTWRVVPGRDKAWADEQRRNLGKVKFAQEQLVEFLGSTNTVIDPNVLEIVIGGIEEPIVTDLNGKLMIYEKPEQGNTYVIGCDVAKGTGENYSVMQILKLDSLNPLKFTQVATYLSNTIDVYSFADVINRTSYYFNNAMIMCENNAEGSAIVNRIWWEHENPNLINSGGKTADLGIRANKTTKPKAVLLMKKLIEDGDILLKDRETVKQLSSFIDENGKYKGKDTNDDCVSALYWAIYIVEMNVLDKYHVNALEEKSKEDGNEDIWGILSDAEPIEEDFRWLLEKDLF